MKNIKIGDKIKSELRAITCAMNEDEEKKKVEWKHNWIVSEVDDEKIKVKDNKDEVMFFDRSGRGFMPHTNHFIYKINGKKC